MNPQLAIAKTLDIEFKFRSGRREIAEFLESKLCSDLIRLFSERAVAYKLQIADNESLDLNAISKLRGYAAAQSDAADLLSSLVELYDTVKDDENIKKEDY